MLEMTYFEYAGALIGAAGIGAAVALYVLSKLGKIKFVGDEW